MATIQQQLAQEYNVTLEQIDRCSRWIDCSTNTVFYLIESGSHPGTYYKVLYNRERGGLQCLPHNGEACPASVVGLGCYHKRAACAAERIFRYEQKEGARREAEAVEAQVESRYEKALFDLEAAKQELAEAEREAAAVRKHGLKAYEHQPLKLENGIPMR